MRIDINQHKISLGEKYNISVQGSPAYRAASKLFRLLSEIVLFTIDGDQPLLTIKKRSFFSFLKKYDIIRRSDIYPFRMVKFWRRHYRCFEGKNTYDIYGHRSRKFSVFKNDKQVGWWELARVAWFAGDNYAMIVNADVDRELLISFCLIIDDSYAKRDKKGTLNLHIGYMGPEARPFDPNWRPTE